MKNYIKTYDLTLIARGPVFIGSGQDIKKKEYILIPAEKKIIIPDIASMYLDLERMGKSKRLERFLLSNQRQSLGEWLREEGISEQYFQKWKRYELDMGDAIQEKGRPLRIMSFMKDPYGEPYIPGSSLKGMLRTILLFWELSKNPGRFAKTKVDISRTLNGYDRVNRNSLLAKETKIIETDTFHTLNRPDTKVFDMVNDQMSGLIVSDSLPLSVEDLTLCQKIEYHKDGKANALNILRECIKPGCRIHFLLSIDTTICQYERQDIEEAVRCFAKAYDLLFVSKFRNADKVPKDSVWLGGGAGYFSKTIVYSLFQEEAVSIVQKIMEKTVNQKTHGHSFDVKYGVSPHILKMTKYKGEFYHFGECGLEIQ